MKGKTLVTGANGHLGINLVRALVAKGENVIAGVRNVDEYTSFTGLNCEVVHADLLDPDSLHMALKNVDTLYQVAAVFKHWSRYPEAEIIRPNLKGTENILKAAARRTVKKVVYVSSIGALDMNQPCVDERSWNQDDRDPYYYSKTESEKLALRLAQHLDLFLVSVLPAAMIGGYCPDRLTPSMDILDAVLKNKRPVDVRFNINFVSVEDVVEGMIAAAGQGRNGERYILGNETPVNTSEIFRVARSIWPTVRIPPKPPRLVLVALAAILELAGRFTGKEIDLTRDLIRTYHMRQSALDLSKSRAELGFNPQDPIEVIRSTLKAMAQMETL